MDVHVFTSHVGYHPDAEKIAAVDEQHLGCETFRLFDWSAIKSTEFTGRIQPVETDWGRVGIVDFSDWRRPGMYQIQIGENTARSVPFTIAEDVYIKTFKLAFGYYPCQRCGVAVPGYHPACHMDDAVLRGTGEHVDATGGWHDAGDVRKWMRTSLPAVYNLLDVHERLRLDWHTLRRPWDDLLDEVRWEGDYYLKMQNPATGEVYNDVAGGIDSSDNSDNRWSDNIVGSGDDRRLNPRIVPEIQWGFVAVQLRMAWAFRQLDAEYARRCLRAAERCLAHLPAEPTGDVVLDSTAVLAFRELYRHSRDARHRARAHALAESLLGCQEQQFAHNQNAVRGYFYTDTTKTRLFKRHCQSALPIQALATLALDWPDDAQTAAYLEAVRMYVRDYASPMTSRSGFGIVPHGLYLLPPMGGGRSRALAGDLTYRYFKWNEASSLEAAAEERETFEHGGTSHLLDHAVALLMAWRLTGDTVARHLAMKQIEWVMGANPLGICLMLGGGINTPYPHATQVGIIPGGIYNGFIGHGEDVPFVADEAIVEDWSSTEYWCQHNALYMRIVALLYEGKQFLY
jgi:glycosyl hydrolase family 9/cellulase-like Ig domain-containing protein